MSATAATLENLRSEYQAIAARAIGARADDPDALRLQAREMEIVDEIKRRGLSPDVLVAP